MCENHSFIQSPGVCIILYYYSRKAPEIQTTHCSWSDRCWRLQVQRAKRSQAELLTSLRVLSVSQSCLSHPSPPSKSPDHLPTLTASGRLVSVPISSPCIPMHSWWVADSQDQMQLFLYCAEGYFSDAFALDVLNLSQGRLSGSKHWTWIPVTPLPLGLGQVHLTQK